MAWLIGPAFLVLAFVIYFLIPTETIPLVATPAVRPASISTAPRRTPLGDPPVIRINGVDHRCNDCHSIIEPRDVPSGQLVQHTEIVLRHGMNNRCYNCHDEADRELLRTIDGTTPYTRSEKLCASCHGRMYRDWTRGAHGKTMGSWDPDNQAFHRLTCVQCHDPHAPMFDPIEPLPGPRTLRMGTPGSAHQAEVQAERNPLLQWSEHGGAHGTSSDGGHD